MNPKALQEQGCWVAPGDFLLMLIAVTGQAVLRLALGGLKGDRTADVVFLLGVGLAASVATDSIDPSMWFRSAGRLQQSQEEVVKLTAGLCRPAVLVLRLLSTIVAQPFPWTASSDLMQREGGSVVAPNEAEGAPGHTCRATGGLTCQDTLSPSRIGMIVCCDRGSS